MVAPNCDLILPKKKFNEYWITKFGIIIAIDNILF